MLLLGNDKCDILPTINQRHLTKKIKDKARANDAKARQKIKRYADSYQNTKHRDLDINDPVLHAWDRKFKHQPLLDTHPYRITAKNHNIITATRSNHKITRNIKKF